MQLNRFEFWVPLVNFENLLCPLYILGASHKNMAFGGICPKLFYRRRRYGFIRAPLVEFDYATEANGLEVLLLLRLPKRVREDELSIEGLAVFPERGGRELKDFAIFECSFECAPCGRFRVMGLIDKKMTAMGRYALLHRFPALTGDTARCDNDVATAEHVIDPSHITRNMLKD